MKLEPRDIAFRSRFGRLLSDSLDVRPTYFAKALGVSYQTVCCWRRGHCFPSSVPTLQKMDYVFDGEIARFIAGEIGEVRSDLFGGFVNYEMPEPVKPLDGISSRSMVATYLGAVVREAQSARGLSSAQLSRTMGVSSTCYLHWTKGESLPQCLRHLSALDELTGGVVVEALMTYGDKAVGLQVTTEELAAFDRKIKGASDGHV